MGLGKASDPLFIHAGCASSSATTAARIYTTALVFERVYIRAAVALTCVYTPPLKACIRGAGGARKAR